jgi:deoxyribodipyrimidine photo-lyase
MKPIIKHEAIKAPVTIFWFRRDLNIDDNRGLRQALMSGKPILPLFIADTEILSSFEKDHPGVSFLCEALNKLDRSLRELGSFLKIVKGTPREVFEKLTEEFTLEALYANRDYTTDGIRRDREVESLLHSKGILFHTYGDHLIFEPGEVMKDDGTPYTVFTPFSKKWLSLYSNSRIASESCEEHYSSFLRINAAESDISPAILGFQSSGIITPPPDLTNEIISNYHLRRDYPAANGTTRLGPHLRFGTISLRKVLRIIGDRSPVLLSELIWREFFMHILWHFPYVETEPFKPLYRNMDWINNEGHFERWQKGMTGYPLVDAGMRELSATGHMHNRVRMITASFLVKHLLTDWQWGESWFASRLTDFELSSNNGNWQWVAGCGCDASPWFRIFSPEAQLKKFDAKEEYIRKWIPEYGTPEYPGAIVADKESRHRAKAIYDRLRQTGLAIVMAVMMSLSFTGKAVSQEMGPFRIETLSLLFMGDIMGHDMQIAAALNDSTGGYDYSDVFKYIAPVIRSHDFAIANLEVTLGGAPYKGYPRFSSPSALAAAARDAGIDVLMTANNHIADRGVKGISRTLHKLDSLGILHTGTYRSAKDRSNLVPLILEKNGIRLALLNYTYGMNGLAAEEPAIVDHIEKERITGDIKKSRDADADAVVVFLHWGKEYDTLPSSEQKELAEWLFLQGADLVIGSHPHVLQPMIFAADEMTGPGKLLVYSLGNFVSNQRKRYRDGGAMASVTISRAGEWLMIDNAGFILTWVYSPIIDNRRRFRILPAALFENHPNTLATEHDRKQMKLFLDDSRRLSDRSNKGVNEIIPADYPDSLLAGRVR